MPTTENVRTSNFEAIALRNSPNCLPPLSRYVILLLRATLNSVHGFAIVGYTIRQLPPSEYFDKIP